MFQRINAMNLVNFYRNTAFDDRYDVNSFIGMILDYNLWSDDEYWKLEADLKKILQHYKNKELHQGMKIFIKSNFSMKIVRWSLVLKIAKTVR